MSDRPATLRTAHLTLRPFRAGDAPAVERMAGDRDIASTTCSIPHPYPAGAARVWIDTHAQALAEGRSATFAIALTATDELVGAIGFEVNQKNDWAELGYWIGKPYWGRGYATEALRALIPWAFEHFHLHRLQACHFTRNPASGRVMEKAGMTLEGVLRQRVKKWGRFEDIAVYSILHGEQRGS